MGHRKDESLEVLPLEEEITNAVYKRLNEDPLHPSSKFDRTALVINILDDIK